MAKTIFEMPRGDAEFDSLEVGEKMPFSGFLRKEGQDKACLVSVNGETVPGYSDSDEEEDEDYEEESSEKPEEEVVQDMAGALDGIM